ncbi:hypothetical protein M5E89_14180 [Acidaminococcus intestini]|nr:hypothetical protein M5E89_14180 [Acidaminococcus intestini]
MILWGRDLCLLFLDAANTVELDLAALYLRRMGYCLWVLGILNVCRMSIQGLGNARKAMMSGVLEMIARTVVSVLLLAPLAMMPLLGLTRRRGLQRLSLLCLWSSIPSAM